MRKFNKWCNGFRDGQLIDWNSVSNVRIDVGPELVRRYLPRAGTTKRQNHIGRHASTASPIDETLNRYTQPLRKRLGSASLLDFFIECVHATKSKRYV